MSVTWIEASAGTGKTYTLVQTVLRLVAQGRPVERILMVTFTDKATAELKTRIREGLREEWKKTSDARLAQALEDLASLSITTIHGFCRALLTQFPLESGVSFEPELVDQGKQWRRLLRDELRPRLTTLEPGLLTWAGVEDEEELLSLARQALDRNLFSLPLAHPTIGEQATFSRYRNDLEAGSGPIRLPADSLAGLGSDTVERLLHASWHKKPYQAVRTLLAARDFRGLLPCLSPDALEAVAKWTVPPGTPKSIWKKAAGADLPPPVAEMVDFAIAFTEAVEALESALPEGVSLAAFLKGGARHQLLKELCLPVLERRSAKELTFHDLIDRVRTLVTDPNRPALAEGAAGRWDAVLIDEFQDTDPEQWDIFRTLFADANHELVLVGDPKQSIYRFRGADLDVYRAVREQVKAEGAATLVLEENFRSTAPMIAAVNALFDPSRAPWDHPDDFSASKKGAKPIAALYRLENGTAVELPPLAVYTPTDERAWHRHLVRTVLDLLDGRHVLDDGSGPTALTPGDVMILVRRKKEAWALYRLLTAQGIPATVGGSGGLLRGREAQEILLFLKALESPRSLSAGRALTWTRLFAGASLERLMPALDEAQADRDRGAFLRAFRRVAAALEPNLPDGGGLERLLALPEGPRIVTNAEHVLELVQERFHRGEVPAGQAALSLETWIQSRLQEDEVDLRRDRETKTLRLMTVHAAKGLEAPVVLHGLPSEARGETPPWLVAPHVDFLKTAASQEAEERSRRAEDLRLRYVALTRARAHQVFVDAEFAGALTVPETALPSIPWTSPEPERPVPTLAPAIDALDARHPWVESHSGLWHRALRGEEAAATVWDRGASRDDEAPAGPQPETIGLPAGAEFGTLVHDILELADFRAWAPGAPAESLAVVQGLVEEHCLRHRGALQNRDWSRPVAAWLAQVLNQSFELGDAPPVTFTALAPEALRRELEFHLPLAPNAPGGFDWQGRSFTVHQGYLTGRIDLLFTWQGRLYLADWKTNRLTADRDLSEVMVEEGYDLQARWYWQALKRLAALQKEPLPLGGVLYVFLRGSGSTPRGVFLDRATLESGPLSTFLREVPHG